MSEGTNPPAVTDMGEQPDISTLMNPGSEKRQGMAGFDDDYVDIVDYIIRCTHKIWEEKAIGQIYHHYRHNSVIHTADGMTYGRDKVIADSTRTMAAFPDLRLYGDEVIWSGNDEDGYHSSHRITWVGHNTGHSVYGPPTGRRVNRRGIAHCFVRRNRVVEEWICRDELALIRQLGLDEHELARRMVRQEADRERLGSIPMNTGAIERVMGQGTPVDLGPEPSSFDVEDFLRRSHHEIWNWRLLNRIDHYYVDNYIAFTSPNRTLYGRGDLRNFVLERLAAFSDASMTVDHICYLPDGEGRFRTATRWTFQGTHDGPGIYGEPTGSRVRLMGISHHQIENGKFVQEWSCFDEFSLLKQLYRGQLRATTARPESTAADGPF